MPEWRHGDCESVEYVTWASMRSRCLQPGCPTYPRYGGRGITICDRWEDYNNFLADMGRRPGNEYSIDRIDNDGPYSPENCRWTTIEVQNKNKRPPSTTIWISHEGETKSLSDWARDKGLVFSCLYARIVTKKWDTKRALETPTRRRNRNGCETS